MQIYPAIGPGNGLYPASRNQQGAVVEPVSGYDVQIAEMPGDFVHDETFQVPNLTIRGPNFVPDRDCRG
jgi:hypothetical protein